MNQGCCLLSDLSGVRITGDTGNISIITGNISNITGNTGRTAHQ